MHLKLLFGRSHTNREKMLLWLLRKGRCTATGTHSPRKHKSWHLQPSAKGLRVASSTGTRTPHFGSRSWLISILILCQAERWSSNSSKMALPEATLAESLTATSSGLSKPGKELGWNGLKKWQSITSGWIPLKKTLKFRRKENRINLGSDFMFDSKQEESENEKGNFSHLCFTPSQQGRGKSFFHQLQWCRY